jgi:hypothetical protein
MKLKNLQKTSATIFYIASLTLICVSCSVSDISEQKDTPSYLVGLHKNDVIILKEPCYLFVYPHSTYLTPTNSNETAYHEITNLVAIIPVETKVKFLGAYKYDAFMSDAVNDVRDRGRILNGKFQGKKVSIEDLVAAQLQKPIFFEKSTN